MDLPSWEKTVAVFLDVGPIASLISWYIPWRSPVSEQHWMHWLSLVQYRCRAARVRHCMSRFAVVRRNLAFRVSWARTIALALRFASTDGKSKSALSRNQSGCFLDGWPKAVAALSVTAVRNSAHAFSWSLWAGEDELRWLQNKVWNRFTLTGSSVAEQSMEWDGLLWDRWNFLARKASLQRTNAWSMLKPAECMLRHWLTSFSCLLLTITWSSWCHRLERGCIHVTLEPMEPAKYVSARQR